MARGLDVLQSAEQEWEGLRLSVNTERTWKGRPVLFIDFQQFPLSTKPLLCMF